MMNVPNEPLGVTISHQGDVALVSLTGAADAAAADVLRGRMLDLVATKPSMIVLDLSGLSFMGSAALGAVVLAHIRCRSSEASIRLVSPQASVERTLAVTRLDKLFDVFETVDAAIAGRARTV